MPKPQVDNGILSSRDRLTDLNVVSTHPTSGRAEHSSRPSPRSPSETTAKTAKRLLSAHDVLLQAVTAWPFLGPLWPLCLAHVAIARSDAVLMTQLREQIGIRNDDVPVAPKLLRFEPQLLPKSSRRSAR